jgi:hypothetical protein
MTLPRTDNGSVMGRANRAPLTDEERKDAEEIERAWRAADKTRER